MTNLEAIQVNISGAHGVVLSENHFVKALTDVGLTATGTYSVSDSALINQATIKCYDMIIGGANLREGDLSYSIDINSVKAAKEALEVTSSRKDRINRVSPW
jgi:hypothetical protein